MKFSNYGYYEKKMGKRFVLFLAIIVPILIALSVLIFFYGIEPLNLFNSIPTNSLILKARSNRLLIIYIAGIAIACSTYLSRLIIKNDFSEPGLLGFQSTNLLVYAIIFSTNIIWYKDVFDDNPWVSTTIYFIVSLLISYLLIAISGKYNQNFILILGIIFNVLIAAFSTAIIKGIRPDDLKPIFDKMLGTIWQPSTNNSFSDSYLVVVLIIEIVVMVALILFDKQIAMNISIQYYGKTMKQQPSIFRFFLLLLIAFFVAISFNLLGMINFVGLGASLISSSMFKGKNKLMLVSNALIIIGSLLLAEFFHSFISKKIVHGVSISFLSIPVIISFIWNNTALKTCFKKFAKKGR